MGLGSSRGTRTLIRVIKVGTIEETGTVRGVVAVVGEGVFVEESDVAEIRGVVGCPRIIRKPSPIVDGRLGLKRTTFVIDFYRTER